MSASTDIATVPAAGTPAVRTRGTVAPKVNKTSTRSGKKYSFPVNLEAPKKDRVAKAVALQADGATSARAASVLGCTTGQYAMLCYQGGTTPTGGKIVLTPYGSANGPKTPEALAKAVAADRLRSELSWGKVAAMYGVTEGTAMAAFTAHTGRAANTHGVKAWRHRNG